MRLFTPICFLFIFSLPSLGQERACELTKLCGNWSKDKNMHAYLSILSDSIHLFSGAVGYADIENKRQADSNLPYAIGSLTKTYVACLTLVLVEEEKISLDQSLDVWYPEMPYSSRITVRSLLNHHSGLSDKNYFAWKYGGKNLKLTKKAVYANVNYGLLGEILEKVDGRKLRDQLRDRVFEPLNMQNTQFGIDSTRTVHEQLVAPYALHKKRWKEMPHGDLWAAGGAGAMISTAEDNNKFLQALFEGRLVSNESLKMLYDFKDGYGMGLFPANFYQMRGYTNSGGFGAYQSTFVAFPDQGIYISILCNGMATSFNQKLKEIMEVLQTSSD
jgi:CubicO group peptidase (beta-lactamase class C family)